MTFIGIDEATHGQVSDFSQYLQHPENRKQLSFELRDGGYDTIDHQATEASRAARANGVRRLEISPHEGPASRPTRSAQQRRRTTAGRSRERAAPGRSRARRLRLSPRREADAAGRRAAADAERPTIRLPRKPPAQQFDPARETHTGIVMGIALASFPRPRRQDAISGAARRRRQSDRSHRRHAAQGRTATRSRSSTSTKAR